MKRTLLDLASVDLIAVKNMNIADDEIMMFLYAYHLQQGFEKIFKYLLTTKGVEYTKTHNLAELKILIKRNNIECNDGLTNSELVTLTTYESSSRCDGNFFASMRELKLFKDKLIALYDSVRNRKIEMTKEF